MNFHIDKLIAFSLSSLLMVGCVSQKKYDTAETRIDRLEAKNQALAKSYNKERMRNKLRTIDYNENLEARYDDAKSDIRILQEKLMMEQAEDVGTQSIVQALHDSLTYAFSSFLPEEINYEVEDGQVRITFAEQVFFKSGKAKVGPRGRSMLQRLSDVLAYQDDQFKVMVIGHADDRAIVKSSHRDNWALSAKRGTAVTRVLQDCGVDPDRMTAAGQSHYQPIASNTSELGRAMNRRTEIVLIPLIDLPVMDVMISEE